MTREEAIKILKRLESFWDATHEDTDGDMGYEEMTALAMAIEALEQQTIVQCEDCKYQRIDPVDGRLGIRVCDMYEHTTTSDFFCAMGERREP